MVQASFFSSSLKKVHNTPNPPPIARDMSSSPMVGDRGKLQAAASSNDYLTLENLTDLEFLGDEANLPIILSDGYPSGAETIEIELSPRGREHVGSSPATPKFGNAGFDEQDSSHTIGRVMGMLRKKASD